MLERLFDINKNEKKSYYQRRLVAEMKFAWLLSKKLQGQYDAVIREAEEYVAVACAKEGIVTQDIMERAEAILMPLSKEAKEYELMCAAHAHIDMNWQWGWDETVKVVLDTTKSILKIMEEYPQFKFSQSQASIYKILEDYAPDLLSQVKMRVQEGRWEVSAATWVEADKNMPGSESAVRQILYAKQYLSDLLDIPMDDLVLDFEPDTFGHSVNIPEILTNANVKYYYHCRGMNDCKYQLYVWRAPSGAEIIVNRERNFYLVDVNPDMALHAFSTAELTGIKKTLHVYGVGDHGGGPTRRDVERLLDMNDWPIYPAFQLATYREFFDVAETYRDQLPVYEGEMNCIFDGCFTSQSRNKTGNRASEELLYKTELFSTFAHLNGKTYPRKMLTDTWQKVLLNQFHDIITGSGVRATREYAMGMYQDIQAAGDSMKHAAYHYIADRINTELIVKAEEISRNEPDLARSYGAGVGSGQVERGSGNTRIFHIFNPTADPRTENIEILLWEWYGDPERLEITDAAGRIVEHQILDKGYHEYWYHNYMKLLIRPSVPGFGYNTIKVTEKAVTEIPIIFHWERRQQVKEDYTLENEYIRVEFDRYSAGIRSVFDKKSGQELIDIKRKSGIFQYVLEANRKEISEWRSEMSSWLTGRFKEIEDLGRNLEITMDKGDLRSSITYHTKFHHSELNVTITLEKGSRSLKYQAECDWHEIGNEETGVPRLQFVMPLPYQNTKYIQDIPFGAIERGELGSDTPAMTFTAAYSEDGKNGIGIYSRNTYGYRCEDNSIALALLRSSFDPDPYPENGVCRSEFCVSFLEKRTNNADLIRWFEEHNYTMDVVSGSRHSGTLAPEASYIKIEAESVHLAAVKVAEQNDEVVLRLYETEGVEQKVILCFENIVKRAVKTDLLERETGTANVFEHVVEVEMKAFEIATVKVAAGTISS